MINRAVVYSTIVLVTLLLRPVFALDCPKFPEQAKRDWEVKVDAEVAKIGLLKGVELKTSTRSATKNLFANLPDAGRVYLEQMMLAAYCSSLRDDKTITDTEKSKRLKDYIMEVRRAITAAETAKTGNNKALRDANKNHKEQMASLTNIQKDIKDIKKLIDNKSKAESPKLEKQFPGGFTVFGVVTDGSATAWHPIIRGTTSDSIDMTWESATITELTPSNLTIQLQNIKIIQTQKTSAGTKPAGTVILNGKAIWQIDRRQKLVYINNAINFWGYVIGGLVLYDTNDALIVAIGLQRIEGQEVSH